MLAAANCRQADCCGQCCRKRRSASSGCSEGSKRGMRFSGRQTARRRLCAVAASSSRKGGMSFQTAVCMAGLGWERGKGKKGRLKRGACSNPVFRRPSYCGNALFFDELAVCHDAVETAVEQVGQRHVLGDAELFGQHFAQSLHQFAVIAVCAT